MNTGEKTVQIDVQRLAEEASLAGIIVQRDAQLQLALRRINELEEEVKGLRSQLEDDGNQETEPDTESPEE